MTRDLTQAIDEIARSEVVYFATTTRDGREIITPIGAVIVDGVAYIRSQNGAKSMWYKRVQRSKRAAFVVGSSRFEVAVANATDPAILRRVDAATYAKYGGPLRTMVLRVLLARTRRFVMSAEF